MPSPEKPNNLQLALSKEQEGDRVVESEDGRKILLVGVDIAPTLEEMVFDYKETPEAKGFTLTKSTSD